MLTMKRHKGILLVLTLFCLLVIVTNFLIQSFVFLEQTESAALTKMFIKNSLYSSVATLIIVTIFGLILSGKFKKLRNDYEAQGENLAELSELNLKINSLLEENRAYMDLASDGVHILDEDGNVVTFSHSFANMLGYSEDETTDLNVRDWDITLQKDQTHEIINNITHQSTKFETQHKRKDGSFIDVEINAKWITVSGSRYIYASSRDVTERKKMEEELHKIATTDFLTQLPSRRMFNKQLEEELERCCRNQALHTSVVLLDIDYFKSINDTYGHSVGDIALQHIAKKLNNGVRMVDLVSRFGGDEFGLILVGADEDTALCYLNRIRSIIEISPLVYEDKIVPLSASFGVAEIKVSDSDINAVLIRADQALYCAKNQGRNRVVTYKGMNKC